MKPLPPGWRWSTVATEGQVDLGRQRHPDWHTGPNMKPYLRVANVFEDRIDTADLKEMDFNDVFERYRLVPGDVLLNEGQSPEWLGRPAIYRGLPEDVGFTNTLLRFRARPAVTPEWALTVFRHYMHSGRFAREARITTNIAHLSATRFKAVEFPVPPIDEQNRIVEVLEDHVTRLDAGDGYASASERRLRALNSAVVERTFRATPESHIPLGEIVAKIEAGKSLGSTAGPAEDGEWGIIKVSAMTWGEFRATENKAIPSDRALPKYEIRPGDLLVSRANTSDYVGASVLVPNGVRSHLLLSDKSLRLIPTTDVDPGWLWRVLQSPGVRSQISRLATGTKDSMRNISQKSLLQVQVPHMSLPDQHEAVQQYAVVESQLSNLRRALSQVHARSQSLRRAVLEAAFEGQLTGRRTDYEVIEERAHAG